MSSGRADPARLRVLRVITRLNVGGPALQAILLTERLDRSRFETALVSGEPASREGSMLALRPSQVRPTIVPSLAREISPRADAATLFRLITIMRAYRPHVVHTHLAKAGLIGRVAARLVRVPIVVHTFHGNVLQGYFGPVQSRFFLTLERALAHMSTRVITISPQQSAEVRRLGVANAPRLVEIPLGVELEPFRDSPRGVLRRELGVDERDPLIGIVGRLVPIKRVDVFLEAVSILQRSVPPLRAVVVGDGEERPALETMARAQGIEDRVTFLGWRADLASVYGDLDVVVLTSDNEGTPVSILEALAASRPVVATDVGGVADVLGRDGGILVPRRDPRAIADAVAALLRMPLAAERLGTVGRARVFPAYDAATLVRRIQALYSDLAGERGLLRP